MIRKLIASGSPYEPQIGGMHGEFFRDIRPASTMIQVAQLLDPDWLVEIEADAVIDGDAP